MGVVVLSSLNFWVLLKMNRTQIESFREHAVHLSWGRRLRNAVGLKPRTFVRENLNTTELPVFDLNIKPKALNLLKSEIPSLNSEVLVMPEKSWAKGQLVIDGEEYQVKVRFRGDNYWHWGKPQKSWRVKFPKDHLYHGIRKLNINNPKSVDIMSEVLVTELAKAMGLLTAEMFFIHMRLNGQYQGVQVGFSQPDKSFLEYSGRPRGDVYGEIAHIAALWRDPSAWRKYASAEGREGDFTPIISLLNVLNDTDGESFKREIPKILDMETFLTWVAHASLVGSTHQNRHNIKLYFDPVLRRFEPIPWDVKGLGAQMDWEYSSLFLPLDYIHHRLMYRILLIPEFHHRRDEILWRAVNGPVSEAKTLQLVEEMHRKIKPDVYADPLKDYFYNKKLYEDFYSNKTFEKSVASLKQIVKKKHQQIRKELGRANFNFIYKEETETVPVEWQGADWDLLGGFRLSSTDKVSVRLQGLTLQSAVAQTENPRAYQLVRDTNRNGRLDDSDEGLPTAAGLETIEEIRRLRLATDSVVLAGVIPPAGTPSLDERLRDVPELSLSGQVLLAGACFADYFLLGEGRLGNEGWTLAVGDEAVDVLNAVTGERIPSTWQEGDELHSKTFLAKRELLKESYPASGKSEESAEPALPKAPLVWGPGEVVLNEDTLLPEGSHLEISPGTELFLAPGVSVLIPEGTLSALGTQTAPIHIGPRDAGTNFGVFAVRNSTQRSRLDHVSFAGGSEDTLEGVFYSGAVCFYNASADFTNCRVQDSQGDDGLNCKYSSSVVRNCYFENNSADSIDFDYCQGSIEDSVFENSGNDGIDLSYSTTYLSGNIIKGIGDKGVSVGEKSNIEIDNHYIERAEIGVAVKDLSTVRILYSTIAQSAVGISLYQKKAYFGGGSVRVENSVLAGNQMDISQSEDSKVELVSTLTGVGAERLSADGFLKDSGDGVSQGYKGNH
ncbi:MAG: CotH kinase family protein [Candidatus Omnitrophica bacterium]|nr:CotH kinase family protein [Candidatus Omnitrophota bacterium]